MAENIITVIRKIKQGEAPAAEAPPPSPPAPPPPPPEPTQADAAKVGEVVQKASRYALRMDGFTSIGLAYDDAEELAKRLAWRDQDLDHRVSCAECQHLHGRPGAWRCGNYRRADVGGPAIPSAFVEEMLQNCRGFRAASQMISEKVSEGGF